MIKALQAASERGLAVPGSPSVAGFDDIDMAAHVFPPLTTVRAGSDEVGRRADELLFHRRGDPDGPSQ
jgi:LacI family transcriptional regulator